MKTSHKLFITFFSLLTYAYTFSQAYIGQNDFYLINTTNCDVDARVSSRDDPSCPVPCNISVQQPQPSSPGVLCYANDTTLVHTGSGSGEWSRIWITFPGSSDPPSYDGNCDTPTGTVECGGYQVHVEWDNCTQARVVY